MFYDSSAVGGFRLHLSGAFEDGLGGTDGNRGAALTYGGGAVHAMLVASRNASGDTVRFAGLRWALGQWTLMGALDRSVYRGPTDSTAEVVSAGLQYDRGANNLKLGWAHRDVDGQKTNFIGLGAEHTLSKRSSVYLSVGRSDPQSLEASTAYGVGVSHSF